MIPSWIILALTLGVARAAPTFELHAQGAAGDEAALRGAGLGVAVGFLPPVGPPMAGLAIEGLVEAGFTGEGTAHLSLRPELRLPVSPADAERARLSLLLGYGLGLRQGPFPEGALGLALDIPGPGALGARIQGRYLFDGISPEGFALSLGALWSRPEVPEPVVAPAPPPEPPARTVDITPPDAKIWIPHPYCAWLSPAEVLSVLDTLSPEVQVRVVASGYLPAEVSAKILERVTLQEAPRQGSLIVAARPGDAVLIDGRPITVGSDGITVVSAPESVVRVTVRGGGRSEDREAAVGTGLALWLRVPDPQPMRVLFGSGSSVLREAERQQITGVAALSEGWRFEVQGTASPEGNTDFNLQLGDARARTVAGLLVQGGVPAERVTVLPAIIATPEAVNTDPALLRYATIRPVPAEVRP